MTDCTVISAEAVLIAGHSRQVWPIRISINRDQAWNLARRLSDKVLACVAEEQKPWPEGPTGPSSRRPGTARDGVAAPRLGENQWKYAME